VQEIASLEPQLPHLDLLECVGTKSKQPTNQPNKQIRKQIQKHIRKYNLTWVCHFLSHTTQKPNLAKIILEFRYLVLVFSFLMLSLVARTKELNGLSRAQLVRLVLTSEFPDFTDDQLQSVVSSVGAAAPSDALSQNKSSQENSDSGEKRKSCSQVTGEDEKKRKITSTASFSTAKLETREEQSFSSSSAIPSEHAKPPQRKKSREESSQQKRAKRQKKRTEKRRKFDFSGSSYRHVFLKFIYIGENYQGFAKQENTVKTVEEELFRALVTTCLVKDIPSCSWSRCGRTDKGVSAMGQVVGCVVRSKLEASDIARVVGGVQKG